MADFGALASSLALIIAECPLAGQLGVFVQYGGGAGRYGESRMSRMDYEYAPLRLPPNIDRKTAAVQLQIQAEFGGWELARVRLLRDGTRQLLLRRRRAGQALPGLSY